MDNIANIDKTEKINKDLLKEIHILKEGIAEKEKEIEELKKKNKNLDKDERKKQLIEINNQLIQEKLKTKELTKEINNLQLILSDKEKEIKEQKIKLEEFKEKNKKISQEKEELIRIIFMSYDEQIIFAISCKNSDKFSNVESLLYEQYPEIINQRNEFYVHGNLIAKNKDLRHNNIFNNDIIILKNSD